MLRRLGMRKFTGLVIIIFCSLFLLVQSGLFSLNFPNFSSRETTLSVLAGGGIVLGSYLVLGPMGILASLTALSLGGCDARGGNDLGKPPDPPKD